MGIKVAYYGGISDPELITDLIHDVTVLCEKMGWPIKSVEALEAEGSSCQGLRGISLQTHPDGEWLHLHTDSEGRFVNYRLWALAQDTEEARAILSTFQEDRLSEAELAVGVQCNWVETQNGGCVGHTGVCAVLGCLKASYAPGLMVRDDTGFFENPRFEELERQMAAAQDPMSVMN